MRTNILKLSFMALAATVFMTGCSQDEDLTNGVNQNNILTVSATVQNFIPDAATRVTDVANGTGYETKFEENDQIGVYAITDDGTVMCKNMPMTYTSTGTWTSTSPLYFYKNATYIAYSPYNATVSTLSITQDNAITEITNYFMNTVLTDGTKTYKDCDLMTASATTAEALPEAGASAITFNFAHAMSMVEFVIPVKNYKTTSGYEYSGPIFGLNLEKQEGVAAKASIAKLALGKGVYRSLLAPVAAGVEDKDVTFSGEFYVGDGTQPVYFSTSTAFKPTAGSFKKVSVTYTNAPDPTDIETRDIAVGDYYYADGGIVPGTETTIPSRDCIGIVYSTDMTGTDTGKSNGYVIALNDAEKENGEKNLWFNGDGLDYFSSYTAVDATMMADLKGFTAKNNLEVAGKLTTTFEACAAAVGIGVKPVACPDNTTGWYLPTLAQLLTAFTNLAGTSIDLPNYTGGDVTMDRDVLLAPFIKADGNADFPIAGSDVSFFWTCSVNSVDNKIWTLQFNYKGNNKKFYSSQFQTTKMNNRNLHVRPVLAF